MKRGIIFYLIFSLLILAGCEESIKSCSRQDRLRSKFFIPGLEKLYDTISFNQYRIWLDTEDESVFKNAKDISSWNWEFRDSSGKYCASDDWSFLDSNQCTLDGVISYNNDSLLFTLQNGNNLRYKSRRNSPWDTVLCSYRGHFDNRNWFVFANLYFDHAFYNLINYKTGQYFTLYSKPVVAPHGKWLISSGTRFELCALSADTINVAFESEIKMSETELNVKWISANEALLQFRNDIFSRYARLVIK